MDGPVAGRKAEPRSQDFLLAMDLNSGYANYFRTNLFLTWLQSKGDPQTSQSRLTTQIQALAWPPALPTAQWTTEEWTDLEATKILHQIPAAPVLLKVTLAKFFTRREPEAPRGWCEDHRKDTATHLARYIVAMIRALFYHPVVTALTRKKSKTKSLMTIGYISQQFSPRAH